MEAHVYEHSNGERWASNAAAFFCEYSARCGADRDPDESRHTRSLTLVAVAGENADGARSNDRSRSNDRRVRLHQLCACTARWGNTGPSGTVHARQGELSRRLHAKR